MRPTARGPSTRLPRVRRSASARLFAAALLSLWVASASEARAQAAIGEPLAAGDQLLFFFDTRSPRVTFVNVSNPASTAVALEISIPVAGVREVIELGPRSNRIVDPTTLAPEQRGLLAVTPIVSADDRRPVVPPAALLGNYTLANLELGSAFGGNALARNAVRGTAPAARGSIVDGDAIRYQLIDPEQLAIPVYYNPMTLGPPELDGNRLLLAAFSDGYDGGEFSLLERSGSVEARFFDRDGAEVAVANAPLTAGLLDTDLETLAGTSLDSSGKVFLRFLPAVVESGSFVGLFAQTLETFGAGGVLPELALSGGS